MTRFPIRFTGANHARVVLGLTPGNSRVEVFEDRVEVRMGWAFRATIDRASIQSVSDDHDRVTGWGAHGWRGVWLVNGSSSGIVRIELEPSGSAKVCGVPVELRVLRVSVEDPAGLRHCFALT
jgi:hypothetical protein